MTDDRQPVLNRADAILAALKQAPELLAEVADIIDPDKSTRQRHGDNWHQGMAKLYLRQYAIGVAEDEQTSGTETPLKDLPNAFRKVKGEEPTIADAPVTMPDATRARVEGILQMINGDSELYKAVVGVLDPDNLHTQSAQFKEQLSQITLDGARTIAEREQATGHIHDKSDLAAAFYTYKKLKLFEIGNDMPTPERRGMH